MIGLKDACTISNANSTRIMVALAALAAASLEGQQVLAEQAAIVPEPVSECMCAPRPPLSVLAVLFRPACWSPVPEEASKV